jgi:hypothetical protein
VHPMRLASIALPSRACAPLSHTAHMAAQLPSPCAVYTAVDAAGIDLSALAPNDTFSSPRYNLPAPWPPAGALPPLASCRTGPCLNTCCTTDAITGACTDNLAANGGHYEPSAPTLLPGRTARAVGSNTCRPATLLPAPARAARLPAPTGRPAQCRLRLLAWKSR